MPVYTKAYHLGALRAYPGWDDAAAPEARIGVKGANVLDDDAIVYLHESLVVTKGIFDDREVLFSATAPEWADFCRTRLEFAVPDWETEAARVRAAVAPVDKAKSG